MSDTLLQQLAAATSDAERSWVMTQLLLQTLSPENAEAVLAAAIPHWFNAETLAAMLAIPPEQAQLRYQAVRQLSFCEAVSDGAATLHDLTRTGILLHLLAEQRPQFATYCQRAQTWFDTLDTSTAQVEATSLLLAVDPVNGLEQFKQRMRSYRGDSNYSAANALIRNGEELVRLGLLDVTLAAEVERQRYLVADSLVRKTREKGDVDQQRDLLMQAATIFDRKVDKQRYATQNIDELRGRVSELQRVFLQQKFEEASDTGDTSRQATWLVEIGDLHQTDEQFDVAIEHYNKAISLNATDKEAIASRGETYRLLKRYEEALSDFNQAIELEATAWRLARRGETYRLLKRYEEALSDFNQAIELDPKYAWAIGSRGQTYQSMERYEEALSDFTQAIALDPTMAWAIASRGETYRLLKRYEEALSDFNQAIELGITGWRLAQRGETYRLLERYEEALSDFSQAIELDPKYTWAISVRGETYRMMKRYEEALSDFTHAIELDPTLGWAIASRGETYRMMKRYEEALSDFTQAIELDPTMAWAIGSRGQAYQALERYEEALSDFTHAIELDPTLGWAIASRGETYRMMKRYEEALSDFTQAIELDPTMAWAIGRRGQTYRMMNRYEEALSDFTQAIAHQDEWGYYQRACLWITTGDNDAAQADLAQAITAAQNAYTEKPTDWQNGFNLALYLLVAGRREEAEVMYQAGINAPASRWHLQEAIDDLDELLELFPSHAEAQRVRQWLQEALVQENSESFQRFTFCQIRHKIAGEGYHP